MMEGSFLFVLLGTTLRITAPIAYAALAATYSERSGVINVGIEGTMLLAAFAGVYGSFVTGNPWFGVGLAVVVGMLSSALLGVACITFQANQIVAGMALNILALGVTRFGLDKIWGDAGVSPSVNGLNLLEVPLLSDLPLVGGLFRQNALVFLLIVIVILSHVCLARSRFGKRVEATGEVPSAAASVGISVLRTRYASLVLAGALAGLGGVMLSLGQLSFFAAGMTAGRGFIGLAANILGRWTAIGAFFAAALFGLAEALQLSLQVVDVDLPSQALLVLPYVLTVVVLAAGAKRLKPPAALGIPYARD